MKTLEYDDNGERIIEGESEDVTNLQENIDAQLSEMFEQFGGDENDAQFKINIYRVQEGRGELGYCFSCVPSELPILDKIRDDYGAGKYEIRVYEKTDKTRLKKRTKLVIEKTQKKPVVGIPQNNSGELKDVISAMMEMQQKQMEQFQQIMVMQRQQSVPVATPSVVNPMEMMTSMVTAMSQLNGLMPKQEMDQFIKGIELAKEFGSDNNGAEKGLADVLITAAKEFAPPLLEMSKMAAQNTPRPVQTRPVKTPVSNSTPPVTEQENDPMLMLKMQLNMLVNKAAADSDPALYADLILDAMPEEQIREFLGQPNLQEFLTNMNPQVSIYWPWFDALQREVMGALDAPVEPESEPEVDLTNSMESADNSPENSTEIIEADAITELIPQDGETPG